MRSIAGECHATNNAKLGFLIKGGPLIKHDTKQKLQLPTRSLGLGPANAGFVLLFGAMPAASRSDFTVVDSKNIFVHRLG
jgi:hypothetical protein